MAYVGACHSSLLGILIVRGSMQQKEAIEPTLEAWIGHPSCLPPQSISSLMVSRARSDKAMCVHYSSGGRASP